MALVGIAALGVYVGLRLAFYRLSRRRSLDLIEARSPESTTSIETMRAVQSIKIFTRETEREAVWTNRYAEVVRAEATNAFLKQAFRIANDSIFGLENVLVVYLGAQAAVAWNMTVGMLFAFISYKQQFVDKAARLIERAIEFRMLDLHLERWPTSPAPNRKSGISAPAAYETPSDRGQSRSARALLPLCRR